MADKRSIEFQKVLGERLRMIREGKPITRYALSKISSVQESMIQRYEDGDVCPSAYKIHMLCRALGVSPNRIYGIEQDPRNFSPYALKAAMIIDKMKESGKLWALWALQGMQEKSNAVIENQELLTASFMEELTKEKPSSLDN